jgi:hypothetical protein
MRGGSAQFGLLVILFNEGVQKDSSRLAAAAAAAESSHKL